MVLLPVESARTIFAASEPVNPSSQQNLGEKTKFSQLREALFTRRRRSVQAAEPAFVGRAQFFDNDDRLEQLKPVMRFGGDRQNFHPHRAA